LPAQNVSKQDKNTFYLLEVEYTLDISYKIRSKSMSQNSRQKPHVISCWLSFTLSFFSLILLTSCTLSLNISELNEQSKQVVLNDIAPPVLAGVVEDGISFGSLTSTPNFSWPEATDSLSGLDYYEIALGSSSGGDDILPWTKISNLNSHTQTGLSLTKGHTYFPKVRAVDKSGNISPELFGNGWIASTLFSFLQPLFTIITGESVNLTLSGGETSYTYSPSQSGYLNTSSSAYTAPLNILPQIENITAYDSINQLASAQVKIRAFENKDIFRSALYQPASTNNPLSIAVDSSNNLYTAGVSTDATSFTHWIIRKSSDGGSTWAVIDDYQLATNKYAGAIKVFIAPNGTVYAVGGALDSSDSQHWIVRKSTNNGVTWTTADDYRYLSTASAANDIGVDSMGNIYVVGDGSNATFWIVRKSTDSGITWTTIDTFQYPPGIATVPFSFTADGLNNFYVTGYGFNASIVGKMLIRKSSDGGSTWTTIVDYENVATKGSIGKGTVRDNNDHLYSTGYGYDATNKFTWFVRKSTDRGGTWTTVDNFQFAAGYDTLVNHIAMDSFFNIYIIGYGSDSTNKKHWLVRKSSDQGSTWTTVDNYQMSPPVSLGKNEGRALSSDSSGNLFTLGVGTATNGDYDHWVVRKSTNGGSSWSLIDDFSYAKKGENNINSLAYDTANGILYSAGYEGALYSRWIVKKSLDQGNTWTTIDTYQIDPYREAKAYKILLNNGNLFVVGKAVASNYEGQWTVRKSSDGGSTWTVIDNWAPYVNTASVAKGISFDSTGIIYVTGNTVDGSFNQHWVTRKSTNNGSSWTTVDDYIMPGGMLSVSTDIAVNSSNHVFVVGQAMNGPNAFWIVRKSTDSGSTWSNINSYQLVNNKAAKANKIYINSSNEIYVAGNSVDSSNIKHGILRKSTDNGTTWVDIDNYQLLSTKDTDTIDVMLDSLGNIFTISQAKDATNYSHWITRKSSNGGTSWTIIDDYVSIDSTKTHIPNTVTNCFTKQICIGGARSVDSNTINEGVVRILSPE